MATIEAGEKITNEDLNKALLLLYKIVQECPAQLATFILNGKSDEGVEIGIVVKAVPFEGKAAGESILSFLSAVEMDELLLKRRAMSALDANCFPSPAGEA